MEPVDRPLPTSGRFDERLREAIARRGLALSRIRDHLTARGQHIGVSTLSYWQNGERQPTLRSVEVVRTLEEVLDLTPGALTSVLPADAERTARRGRLAGITPYLDAVEATVRDLGTALGTTANLSIIEGLTIGPEGSLETKHVHHVVRALDEVDRQVVTYQGELGCDTARLTLTPVSGCRVGRVRRHETAGLLIVELLFDRYLRRHDTHVFQYVVKDDNTQLTREHYRMHLIPGGIHVVDVQFDPAALPVQVEEFHRRRLDEPDLRRRPVGLHQGQGHRAHVVHEPIVPGIVGIAWSYA